MNARVSDRGVQRKFMHSQRSLKGTTLVELLIGIILISGMFGIGIASIRSLMLVESAAASKSRSVGNILNLEYQLRADLRDADASVVDDPDMYELRMTNRDGTHGPTWTFRSDRIMRTQPPVAEGRRSTVETFRIQTPVSCVTSLAAEEFTITLDLGTQQFAEGQRLDQGVQLRWKFPVSVIPAAGSVRSERGRS